MALHAPTAPATLLLLLALLLGQSAALRDEDVEDVAVHAALSARSSADAELFRLRLGGRGQNALGLLQDLARRRDLRAAPAANSSAANPWRDLLEQSKAEEAFRAEGSFGVVTAWHTRCKDGSGKPYELALKSPKKFDPLAACEGQMLENLRENGLAGYVPMIWAQKNGEVLMERFQYDLDQALIADHTVRTNPSQKSRSEENGMLKQLGDWFNSKVTQKFRRMVIGAAEVERGEAAPEYTYSDVGKWAYELYVGLGKLHQAGLCHRDIKPANIMITKLNEAKMVDMGLACYRQKQTEGECNSGLFNCNSNNMVGTPVYMSYQIWQGAQDCAAGDFWALGLTVGQLLARDHYWPSHIMQASSISELKTVVGNKILMDHAISKLLVAIANAKDRPQNTFGSSTILASWLSPMDEALRLSLSDQYVKEWATGLGATDLKEHESQLPKCASQFGRKDN